MSGKDFSCEFGHGSVPLLGDFVRSLTTCKMKAKEDATLDDLARFVQVIGRNKTLRERFCRLAAMSPVQRSNEVHVMAEQMNAENKDRELVSVFRLFADTRVFEAAMVALRDCGYI